MRTIAKHTARRLDLGRRLLLGFAGVLVLVAPVTFGLLHATEGWAQAAAAQKTGIDDT